MGARDSVQAAMPAAAVQARCSLCRCALDPDENDDLERLLCSSCKERPEARRLGLGLAPLAPRRPHVQQAAGAARAFTPAELSLISKVHAFMPAAQLLDLLNERLVCDLGPDAARYTLDHLQAHIARISPAGSAAHAGGAQDWASLRKLLAKARRSGLLERVNEQVINDFAVVFSLNPKQVMVLKDTLLDTQEAR